MLEAKLRDVLVISGNAALSAALVAHDLNVIPVDPAETPGWAQWAAAAHLLVLDLGDADRAVDAVAQLRSRSVETPALVVAESVTDSPRLVSLRLADHNVKTLSWPLTPERLVRAVERAMSPGDRSDEPIPSPATNDRGGVQWPTFDPESFEQSSNLDWRTTFTEGLSSRPVAETRVEVLPPAPAVVDRPAPAARDQAPPAGVGSRPEPPRAAPPMSAPVTQPAPVPYRPAASVTPPPPAARPSFDLDLPPVPADDTRKHRLAPWARPRPGAASRFEASSAAPPVAGGLRPGLPPPPPTPTAVPPAPAMPAQQLAPPPVEAPTAAPKARDERGATRAAEKAREAAEKMQAKALAAAEKEAARARAAAEKEAARAMAAAQKAERDAVRAVGRDGSPTMSPAAASAPEVVEQVRLIPAAPTRAELRAAAEAERAEKVRLEAEAKAAERAAVEAARNAEADAKQRAKHEAEAAKAAERAAVEAAKAAERAAVEAARVEKARLEAEAKAAAEAARNAEADARQRAKYEAEAAKAAERAAAIAAKAAAEQAAADQRAAAEAEKAIEKARIEAARIAEAQARADEKVAREQAEADAKFAQEAARAAEKTAEEQARADERARAVAEREALAQAKVDSKLAAEAAKAARLQAEVEAHQAAVRAREEAEQARVAAKLAAEASRVETIARVKEAAQHTKIKAEATQIVDEAVRKAEEDFSARALANRPVYYGPELEPPGLGYVHQLMAMTESLASPAQIAEELAFATMEHLAGCEAVAVMIPDGDCWTTVSGIGVARSDLRYRLSEEHWFVRHVLGEDEIVLIDDPEALRNELSGVPLTGWRYLVGVPLTDANSMLVAAGSQQGFDADSVAEFAEALVEYAAELAESLSTRDVARQIHDRGGGRS